VATRHHAELLLALCRVVFPERKAHAIYGTLDQQARTDHLKAFRKGDAPLLIVTDVAARGLDVPLVDAVINYDAPAAARLFVHRCGRAARQGRPGLAATLVEPDELPYIVDLHRFLAVWKSTSHFSAMAWPRWLRRAVRYRADIMKMAWRSTNAP